MITKEKRDFILSIFAITLGSGYAMITMQFSVLTYFFIAILLSLIGDLLMAEWIKITEHRTVDGAIFFGLAHLTYIFAFYRLNVGGFMLRQDWWMLVLGLTMIIVFFKLIADNNKLHTAIRVSNALYTIIIVTLFVMVLSFAITSRTPDPVKIISLGGIFLFMLSDSVLAYNEFQKPVAHAKEIIAITYIVAQVLLQLSPLLTLLISE